MPDRVHNAFQDWGDGYRSVSFLITGSFNRCLEFHAKVHGEDFGRMKRTSRIRLFLRPEETEAQTRERLRVAAERHQVTLELLHGAGESEWYELIYLAPHGKRWGTETSPGGYTA